MDDQNSLALRFQENRPHLHSVAYRMLGSLSEADDAVQEAWLRLSRADVRGVQNLGGWLTTVVARVCLDMLRSRKARREHALSDAAPDDTYAFDEEAQLADSVGLALLVVLERLAPAERVAFVLHDLFSMPFEEIAPIVSRSPEASRQLASRARRRVQGGSAEPSIDLERQREVVEAFMAASQRSDLQALLALLDPNVVLRDGAREVEGASNVAGQALSFAGRARFARLALVDGAFAVIVAPRGRLSVALRYTVRGDKIAEVEVITDPARLRQLTVAIA